MSAFWIMLRNVLVFVALAIPGFLLVKTKKLNASGSAALSALLTYVGMPFLVLSGTLKISFTGEFIKKLLIAIVLCAAFIFLLFFLSMLLCKGEPERKKRGMMQFCTIFSNTGFLGIPLASAVFGADSTELTYAIIFNIITNVFMFTLGVYLISGDKKTIQVKKVLLSPVLLGFIAGIILNLIKIGDYVPEVVTFSNHFSNVVTPLSMTVIGIKLGGISFKAIFTNLKTYYVSALKLIVMPVLVLAIALLLNYTVKIGSDMVMGVLIAFATPTAGLASTFSDQHDGDTEGAVSYTLGSTIFSVLTISLLYWILCMII